MLQNESQLRQLKDEDSISFLIGAFMVKIMKYGTNGMKLKKSDLLKLNLKGKCIRVDESDDHIRFTVINDPRN